MNEYVLYQPCITSWGIVLFHPTYLSFSQRLINYGHDSVSNYDLTANQSTSRRGRLCAYGFGPRTCMHAHTHMPWRRLCPLSAGVFFFFFPSISGIMGKIKSTYFSELGVTGLSCSRQDVNGKIHLSYQCNSQSGALQSRRTSHPP